MKKTLIFIGRCLVWAFYLLITATERQKYAASKFRQREVVDLKNDFFGTTITYGKPLFGKEPERNFITWKEYRKIHNF